VTPVNVFRAFADRGRRAAVGVWRHPARRAVTPTGWALVAGGGLAAVVGWGRGWLEFRVLALMAAVVLLAACASVLRRRQHVAVLELHQPRVQAGETALGRVLVTAEGGRSAGPTTMELPVGKVTAAFRVGTLRPGDEHEEMFSIPTKRRGVVPVGPVRSVQADPVGAISRQKLLTAPLELYIHPRLVQVDAAAIGVLKDIEGITTAQLSSSDVSFHALREYVPGDDRRAVHWRTTARMGKLMVRQFEETLRAHLLLLLSTRTGDYDSEDSFERAVSVAGSLGVAALRAEHQVSVLTSTGELRFPHAQGLLDRLSGVELGAQGRQLRELAIAGGGISGISVAALVTGTTPPATLRGAQLSLPPDVRTFAVRTGAGELARRQTGELTVLDVARLGDLAVAVRSLT